MKRQFLFLVVLITGILMFAQDFPHSELPLASVELFSSGVGYFEHTGNVKDSVTIPLVFDRAAVNDILKSLVVRDDGSTAPSVCYASDETLAKTLKSLSIDLSGSPGIAEILESLRGEEIRIQSPKETIGRIVGVEKHTGTDKNDEKEILTLSTTEGMLQFDIAEIAGFSFTDKRISDDLKRALDFISASRNESSRQLLVNLPGMGNRTVTLGYVVPVPVWKASYRLDLRGDKPVIQGWAIVDNTSEEDWLNIRLSLVTGKPVSFVQDLYPPFYFNRPVVPLSIAGAADAVIYDSGYNRVAATNAPPSPVLAKAMMNEDLAEFTGRGEGEAESAAMMTRTDTPQGSSSGAFFQFTLQKPVTIARQQSVMIPLVDSVLEGEKVSVFSAGNKHPKLCVQLTNTSGMKLPAGPVTVFDGGSYAGDALVEFFPEGEKRLLAFGEDLAVTGSAEISSSGTVEEVTASKGVLSIINTYVYTKTYHFRNADMKSRNLIIEHPVMEGAVLIFPITYSERTDSVFRFAINLPANAEASFDIREEKPIKKTVTLLDLDSSTLLYYSTSSEVPVGVRAAMEKAVSLRKKVDAASALLDTLSEKKNDLDSDQERIRKNLEAAGRDTQQGKDYLRKLAQTDTTIEKVSDELTAAKKSLQEATNIYRDYLSGLEL